MANRSNQVEELSGSGAGFFISWILVLICVKLPAHTESIPKQEKKMVTQKWKKYFIKFVQISLLVYHIFFLLSIFCIPWWETW